MSGYNLFLQKNKGDPLSAVEKKCGEEVTCLLDYFRIECFMKWWIVSGKSYWIINILIEYASSRRKRSVLPFLLTVSWLFCIFVSIVHCFLPVCSQIRLVPTLPHFLLDYQFLFGSTHSPAFFVLLLVWCWESNLIVILFWDLRCLSEVLRCDCEVSLWSNLFHWVCSWGQKSLPIPWYL